MAADLQITGTLSPDASGDYDVSGTYGITVKYRRLDGVWYLWYSSSNYDTGVWVLSQSPGNYGTGYWTASPGLGNLWGEYQPHGTATGTATAAVTTLSGTIVVGPPETSQIAMAGSVTATNAGSITVGPPDSGAVSMAGAVTSTIAAAIAVQPPETGQVSLAGSVTPATAGTIVVGPANSSAVAVSGVVQHTVSSERVYDDARGLYRVFNDAVFRFYRSQAGPPLETDPPYATAAELPATPANPFADGTWFISCSWFNGVYDSGFTEIGPAGETYLVMIVSAGVAHVPPRGPVTWSLVSIGGGVIRVAALLYVAPGTSDPDQWSIAYTADGSDPPQNTPGATAAMTTTAVVRRLEYDLPAQADGVTLKVCLQTRRNDGTAEAPIWIYSTPSAVLSIVVDAIAPTAPPVAVSWPGELELEG